MAMDEPPMPLLAPEHLRHPELKERFRALLSGGVRPPLQAYHAGTVAAHRGARDILAVAATGERRGRPLELGSDLLAAVLEAAEAAKNRHILAMEKRRLIPVPSPLTKSRCAVVSRVIASSQERSV